MDSLPKRRFNFGWLISIRRFAIFVAIALLAFAVWPQIHIESYKTFMVFIMMLFDLESLNLFIKFVVQGLQTNPIARGIELAIIIVALWKLILRGNIRAFFRINSIAMIVLSSFWIHLLLFKAIQIEQYDIWNYVVAFVLESPLLVYLVAFGIDNAAVIYTMLAVFVVGYVVTSYLVRPISSEGIRLGRDEMEELGINEVMRKINPIRKIFLPRPRFYVAVSFSQNAYCSGRNIVIAMDIFEEDGEDVAQGVIAHELGHYYHYDIAAQMVCKVCVTTMLLPFSVISLLMKVLSFIPILGLAASIYSVFNALLSFVTSLLINIINTVFYWIDGKWAERSADLFGVDLGFGFGNYLFLSKFIGGFSLSEFIRGFFDVHPGTKSRCRYIKKRIIRNWGEDYWDDLVSYYGDCA